MSQTVDVPLDQNVHVELRDQPVVFLVPRQLEHHLRRRGVVIQLCPQAGDDARSTAG